MIRVGVAGLRRGMGLFNVFARHPEAQIVAVCDLNGARAEAVAREHGVPTTYDDFGKLIESEVDVVVIATPMPAHAAHSIAALDAGKHVLCEVPAVTSLEEAAALAAAARRASGVYMMAENCCFTAFIDAWRRMVTAEKIGKIVYAEAEYIHDCRAIMRDAHGLTWRASMPPIQYCTHSLGPILSLNGDRCVSASGMHPGVNVAPDLGAIDIEVGIFRTAGGAVVKILCGFSLVREPAFHTYTVYGTHGCLEQPRDAEETRAFFDDMPELAGMIRMPLPNAHRRAPGHARLGGHGTSEYYMIHAFVDTVLRGAPNPIDVSTALDYTVPGICAHLSAEEGGRLREIPDYR